MDNSRYQNCHIEMKNVNKDIVAWLETVIDENNSKIDKKRNNVTLFQWHQLKDLTIQKVDVFFIFTE